jgi:hypothetical protein
VVAQQRALDEVNRDTTLAWQIEVLARQKKLRPLPELLIKAPKSREAQFVETMHNISIITGRDPQRVRLVRRSVETHVH